jgi:hypothetical protein
MKLCIKFAAAGASAVVPGACTSTGATERNDADAAAAGAAAGAVIGNNAGDGDAGQGAAIAAVAGGLGGATKGFIGSEDCDAPGIKDQAHERDSDGDGHVDAYGRYPNDRYRW